MGANESGNATGPPASRAVSVEGARQGDVATIAALHADGISEGFLSSLGERFLARLYRRMLATESSVVLVARGPEDVVGFVAGSVAVSRLFSSFVRHDAVPASLASPWRLLRGWRRVIETMRHGGAHADDADDADAELLAIAVSSSWRGHGVGARLVDALLQWMAGAGASTVDVVVGSDNQPAIAMYRRAGFTPLRRFELHRGTSSLVLRRAAARET